MSLVNLWSSYSAAASGRFSMTNRCVNDSVSPIVEWFCFCYLALSTHCLALYFCPLYHPKSLNSDIYNLYYCKTNVCLCSVLFSLSGTKEHFKKRECLIMTIVLKFVIISACIKYIQVYLKENAEFHFLNHVLRNLIKAFHLSQTQKLKFNIYKTYSLKSF